MTIATKDRDGADLDIAATNRAGVEYPLNHLVDSAGAVIDPAKEATVAALLAAAQAIQDATEALNTSAIAGTVAVSNLPSTQAVSGSVSVSNLPSTQPVSGTVAVSNFAVGLTDAQLRASPVQTSLQALNYPASTGNTTTVQLAPNARYTGAIETVQNLQAAQVQVVCDQPYTLTINQYIDAAGLKLTERATFTRLANQPLCLNVLLPGNYFNVTLTNTGIDATTSLQIDTTFGIMDTLPKTLGQKVRDESMAVTLSADDIELLSTILQALGPLQSARGTDGGLRVNLIGGTLPTVSNQSSIGGYLAGPHIPVLTNIAAQANINNMIG